MKPTDTFRQRTRLTRKQIGAIGISIILAFAGIFSLWVNARANEHAQWMVDYNSAQVFMFHLESASRLLNLLNSPSYQNTTFQEWFVSEMEYADFALNPIGGRYILIQDFAHANLLSRITLAFTDWEMCGPGVNAYTCIFGLNQTAKTSASTLLFHIGRMMFAAYSNFGNYTSVDSVRGPSIWYFGPTPPDEGLLQQVVTMAGALKGYWSS